MLLRWVAWCLLAGAVVPSVGLAWTRAHVREARAVVRLQAGHDAEVQLELLVDVQGGWLERLDVSGLEEDLTLVGESPAWVVLESGEERSAAATAGKGVLTLRFERRDGLRRGRHRVGVRYTTTLLRYGADDDSRQPAFTLPGWEAGLQAAEITFVSEEPLRPLSDPDVAQEVSTGEDGGLHTVRFLRTHVPRASPWRATVALPASAPARLGAAALRTSVAEPYARSSGLAAAGFCLALMWLGRLHTRRRLSRQGLAAQSVLGTRAVRSWHLWLLALASGLCWPYAQTPAVLGLAALAVLGCERSAGPKAPLPLGAFSPISRTDQRSLRFARMREHVGVPVTDLTTLLGALGFCALPVLLLLAPFGSDPFAVRDPWGYLSLTALVGWPLASRLYTPRSLAEQVAILREAATKARTVSCALSLVWYKAGTVRAQPRLRLTPGARYAGLLRLEVLVDSRRGTSPLVLSVLVEKGSPAERWTRNLWPDALCEQSEGAPRLCLLMPTVQLSDSVESLLSHFTRESQRGFEETRAASRAA